MDRCAAMNAKSEIIQTLVDSMNNLAEIISDVEEALSEIKEIIQVRVLLTLFRWILELLFRK